MFSFSSLFKTLGGLFAGRSHADEKPPPAARGAGQTAAALAGGNGTTAAAAAAMSHFAEGSTEPVAKTAEQQAEQVERVEAQVENENRKLDKEQETLPPAAEKNDTREALREDWKKARDPKAPMTEAEFQELERRGKELGLDPRNTKPEEVLRDRGVPESAIDTLKNAGNIDAQTTATNASPDLQGKAPAELQKTREDAQGNQLTPMSQQQILGVVTAQSALSEDVQQGAAVRKAVTNGGVLDMLSGGRMVDGAFKGGGMDGLRGDVGLRRNTEGQTSTELVETLGLDYQHASNEYVEWKDPTAKSGEVVGPSATVKNEGVVVIDTTMNAEMAQKAKVPLGADVMAEAKAQAEALRDANQQRAANGEPPLHVPPLLQMTADGRMAHAYERNRTSNLDPRTGLGNSAPVQEGLKIGSDGVNTVNQELNIAGGGAKMDAGKDADGQHKSQMNIVDPQGKLVNLANLVPVTDGEGNPVLGADGKPKTRWALNTNVGDEVSKGQIPQEMLETWKERLYYHQQAQTAAATKLNAEARQKWIAEGKPEGDFVPPSQLPEPIPELAGYKPPEKKA
jgi:hypothetical protein